MTVYSFLKENAFTKTLETFKREMDAKPNMPLKSWALEPVKLKKFNSKLKPKGERHISITSPHCSRQKTSHNNIIKNLFWQSPNAKITKPRSQIESYAKRNTGDLSNQIEHFELEDKYCGRSVDNHTIETKKIANYTKRGSSHDSDCQNFSFCESGSKAKSYFKDSCISGNKENTSISNRMLINEYGNIFDNKEPALHGDDDSILIGCSKLPKPSYIDNGKLISYIEV